MSESEQSKLDKIRELIDEAYDWEPAVFNLVEKIREVLDDE